MPGDPLSGARIRPERSPTTASRETSAGSTGRATQHRRATADGACVLRRATCPVPFPLDWTWRIVATLLVMASGVAASAESPPIDLPATDQEARLDRLERSFQELLDENRRLVDEIGDLKRRGLVDLPETRESSSPTWEEAAWSRTETAAENFGPVYDDGFLIASPASDDLPFTLKINNQNTFRYSAFARSDDSWIDSAGNEAPIFSTSTFMIPRGRLIFSGKAYIPGLSYLLNLDYNTVGGNPLGFRAYALSYRFGRALEVHAGQNKVPGTREWIGSSWDAQAGPDRSMATTFFRPSLSQGIWITGEPLDRVFYHAMVSNGFNTLNLRPTQLDNRLCFSESVWWEPWGDFGRGYSDIQWHDEAAVRLGASFTHTREEGSQTSDYLENSSVRLSDGTLITQTGALAPGVTLQTFTLSLAAIDFAYKRRGLSFSTELYFQDLSSLEGSGPLPMRSLHAHGGVLQGGYFVVPQRVELYSRNSYVTGGYGAGTEVAGGVNWFLLEGSGKLRVTFDAAWLENSPADQNRTGFVAGQSGLLLRAQINSAF